jgi:hypothetical protein
LSYNDVHNAIQKTAEKIRDEFGESPHLEPSSSSSRSGACRGESVGDVEIRPRDGRATVRAAREVCELRV